MKGLALLLGLVALFGAIASAGEAEKNEIVVGYERLVEKDLRLATVGYQLASGSTPFCALKSRNPGWVLHDIAQYADVMNARIAFDFRQPVSIAAIVENSPAAQAGVVPGDGLVARNGQSWSWSAGKGKSFTSARVDGVRAELQSLMDKEGGAMLEIAARGGNRTLHLQPEAICKSDFWVDTRDKRDAGADGERVRVTSGLIDYVADDNELAAVVAHEMAHNLLGHRGRIQSAKRGRTGLIRQTEEEADRLSVWLMANAGYDPQGAIAFWQRYGKATGLGIFSAPTHYRWQARVTMLREEIATMQAAIPEAGRRDPPLLAAHRAVQ